MNISPSQPQNQQQQQQQLINHASSNNNNNINKNGSEIISSTPSAERKHSLFSMNEIEARTSDPLMSEWDDDNVIVIDLTEERSLASSFAAKSSPSLEVQHGSFMNQDDKNDDISLDASFASQKTILVDDHPRQMSITSRLVSGDHNGRITDPLGDDDKPIPKPRQSFMLPEAEELDAFPVNERLTSSTSSTTTTKSAASQKSFLDQEFHCQDLVESKVNENGGTLFQKKILYGDDTRKGSNKSLSKAKSLDTEAEEGKSQNVLARLHNEISRNVATTNDNHIFDITPEETPKQSEVQSTNLAPVKVRPWERKLFKGKFIGGHEITYQRPMDTTADVPGPPDASLRQTAADSDASSATTPMSADNVLHNRKLKNRPMSKSLSSSREGTGSAPMSVLRETSASLRRPNAQPSLLYPRGPAAGQRLTTFTPPANGENPHEFLQSALRTRSSDMLDRMETAKTSRGRTRHSAAGMIVTGSLTPASRHGMGTSGAGSDRMTRIDKGLFLGSIEAATDVILLESNAITHIVSVDSVPLPRKISSIMPRMSFMHMQVSDLPDEDILSHLNEAISFIDGAIMRGGSVLVHCFRGRSRSATVVIAYLMHKHHYKLEKAFFKVKSKREVINPHVGFLAQLKLFEAMDFCIDPNNVQYKMFRLFCAAERMRKAKVLFRDSLDKVLDLDPAGGLPGSAEAAVAAAERSRYPMIYKCRKCRRTLATAFNMLPHVRGETPNWMDDKWARLSEEDVLDDASSPAGLDLCSQSVFIAPVSWMEAEISRNLSGKLYCPNCQCRVGCYSWVIGDQCKGCGANILPSFQLDVTEIIFRTHNRYLQSTYATARGPILV